MKFYCFFRWFGKWSPVIKTLFLFIDFEPIFPLKISQFIHCCVKVDNFTETLSSFMVFESNFSLRILRFIQFCVKIVHFGLIYCGIVLNFAGKAVGFVEFDWLNFGRLCENFVTSDVLFPIILSKTQFDFFS